MFKKDRFKVALTGALVVAAMGLPSAAEARLAADNPGAAVSSAPQAPSHPAIRPEVRDTPTGFQWDDAGLGAAGAALILATGAAASGLARRRRAHRPALG